MYFQPVLKLTHTLNIDSKQTYCVLVQAHQPTCRQVHLLGQQQCLLSGSLGVSSCQSNLALNFNNLIKRNLS